MRNTMCRINTSAKGQLSIAGSTSSWSSYIWLRNFDYTNSYPHIPKRHLNSNLTLIIQDDLIDMHWILYKSKIFRGDI